MSQPPYEPAPERPQDRPQDSPPEPTRAFPTYAQPQSQQPQPQPHQPPPAGSAPWVAPGQAPPSYGQSPYGQPSYGQSPYGQSAYGQSQPSAQSPYGAAQPGQQPPYGAGYGQGQYPQAYGQAPAPYGYGYGYPGSTASTNGLATAALATGIGGIFIGLSAPVGVALGIAALVQIKRTGQAGKGMAIAGLVIGSLVTIGYVLLFTLVIALGSSADEDYGSGQPVSSYSNSPTTSVDDLVIGECFDESGQDSEVIRQPCDGSHDGEVFARPDLPAGDWPGEKGVDQATERACGPLFASYVGKSVAESELEISYWTPTKSQWARTDRLAICAAYGPNQNPLTTTVKNSHR
ncbi:DUF4190 domain-containing protein [Kribbella solani]|uniref:DUF4190 domain-containing protein n=1 Tax=Kribbella solani TaxID=236067 RepID=UPI0029A47D28|nr:DUF4190 domain-containing protein [Kribbella solani]MDX3006080.1 DUF4190 domain-containing protein [Kribbella solani]